MRRLRLWQSCIFVLMAATANAAIEEAPQAPEELAAIAGQLQLFDTRNFVYDRIDLRRDLPEPMAMEYREAMEQVESLKIEAPTLIGLLKHRDAKIRTLSMAVLFARDDPHVLPYFAELVDDHAKTFPCPEPNLNALLSHERQMPKMQEQTVGQVATRLVEFYLEMAGRYEIKTSSPLEKDFQGYWASRKERDYCASWFRVALTRAANGGSEAYINERIRNLRQRLDRVPQPDRTWIVLYCAGPDGSRKLASEEELLQLCREVGPDKLILMLQRRIPSDDPDLVEPQKREGAYNQMALFVLRNASQLLRPGDADALLECWHRERTSRALEPNRTCWWAIAAARLQPARASVILHEAFGHFTGRHEGKERAELAAALLELCGTPEKEYVLDWFFTESPEMSDFPHCLDVFLRRLAEDGRPAIRLFIGQIVRDPRFERLDYRSVKTIASIVNGWTREPVISPKELREAYSPDWLDLSRPTQELPEPARAFLRQLAGWREKLRASVSQWAR
jgi:hypothetical protein